jgi:hypothetical protein
VDFNGDGELDLAFAAYGTAYLYRNTGGGVFTLNDDVTVGFGNHRPATVWGDLNDDGAEDVVVLGDDGRLEQAYLNDGAGDFGDVAQEFQVTSSTYGAALADFDLDGDLDMLGVHNGGGSAAVWDNDGLGVFSDSGAALPQRSASFGAVAGDLNGDSVPDAFGVGNGPNTVWFNTTVFGDEDGDGVVDPADVCPGSDDLADIDGDTVPDGCDACLGTDASGDADGDGLCTDWQPDLAPELVLVPGEVLELEVTAQPDTTLFLMVGRELGEGGCPVWMRTACFGIVAPRLLQTTTSDPEGTATFTIDATGWAGPMGSRAMQVGFVGIDGSVYLGSPSVVGADL